MFPPGPVEALHQAEFDWIARHKHDRELSRLLASLQEPKNCRRWPRVRSHDAVAQIRQRTQAAGRTRREPSGIRLSNVLAVKKTGFSQTFEKRLQY
jgi:hypothetical protein